MQHHKIATGKTFRLHNADDAALESGINHVDNFHVIFERGSIPEGLDGNSLFPNHVNVLGDFAESFDMEVMVEGFGITVYDYPAFFEGVNPEKIPHLYLGMDEKENIQYFAIPEESKFQSMLLSHWVEHHGYDFDSFYENVSKEFKAIL